MKNKNTFRILTYDEESHLNISEKKKYYQDLKLFLSTKPLNPVWGSYLKICEELNKKIVRDIIDSKKGYDLEVRGLKNIPNKTCIFASTHQDYSDHFNVVLSIPEHTVILNTINVTLLFKLLMGVNGIIYVDRNSDFSRFESKTKLMCLLAHNKNIVVFPEGTYNCSPNKLHLPLHSVVIDMALKMQVPIVPMIHHYTYDVSDPTIKNAQSCIVEFAKPIYVNYTDSKKEKLEELSESFSTIRWNLIQESGTFKREDITIQEYINYVLSRIDAWSKINVSIDNERKTIKGANEDFYVFHHINDVTFENQTLLPTKESIRLNEIADTHLSNICLDRNGNIIDADKILRLARKHFN